MGTPLKELSDQFERDYKYDILIAKVNNDIVELSDTITKKCMVEFYDRSTTLGHCVYSASANFILILAVRNILGDSAKIKFEHVLTHEKIEFEVSGDKLQYVSIPVGYQHSINNVGDDELVLLLWANELFDENKSDTYVMEG